MVSASSTSFPSGHALGVMAAVLALLAVGVAPGPARALAMAVDRRSASLVVVAIGVGRVVLNVHHPSDVVAGWALGYVYFVAVPAGAAAAALTAADETPAAPDTAR